MKAVIDRKLYDTETGEQVHEWDNGYMPGDFKFREKILYHTNKGAWFIAHRGGAMTDMGVSVGSNDTGGSEAIEPISARDARAFLESHDGTDAVLAWFGPEIEEA